MKLYEHPHYKYRKPQWQMWRDLHEGRHDTLTSAQYLWPHQQELINDAQGYGKMLRQGRERRTRYLNIPEIVTSLLLSYFFRDEPVADEETREMLGDAVQNMDGYGTSLTPYIKDKITESYLVYGKVINLTDALPLEGSTRAEEQSLRPFWELIHPLQMPDWAIEQRDPLRIGQYNMIRHEYDIIAPRRASDEPVIFRYSDEWYLDDNGRLNLQRARARLDETRQFIVAGDGTQGEGAGYEVVPFDLPARAAQLTEIPVVILDGVSWLKDVCEETLRHYNLRSTKDSIEYFQAYQKIFVSGDGLNKAEQIKALAENIVSILPAGATVTSVPPVSTADIERSIAQSIDNAFKLGLNMLRSLPSDSRVAQSAEAISSEKENPMALIQSALGELEDVVNQSLQHFAVFNGVQNFTGRVKFNRDITEDDHRQFLEIYNAFRDDLKRVEGVTSETVKWAISRAPFSDERKAKLIENVDRAQFISQPVAQGSLAAGMFGGR